MTDPAGLVSFKTRNLADMPHRLGSLGSAEYVSQLQSSRRQVTYDTTEDTEVEDGHSEPALVYMPDVSD